jgi:hypothetical protein
MTPVRRIFKVLLSDCALFRDWSYGSAPVFFDFGKEEPMLWCLLPKFNDGDAYVLEFFRAGFIVFHRNEVIEKDFFADLIRNFTEELSSISRPVLVRQVIRPRYSQPRRHFRF